MDEIIVFKKELEEHATADQNRPMAKYAGQDGEEVWEYADADGKQLDVIFAPDKDGWSAFEVISYFFAADLRAAFCRDKPIASSASKEAAKDILAASGATLR